MYVLRRSVEVTLKSGRSFRGEGTTWFRHVWTAAGLPHQWLIRVQHARPHTWR